ncbi:hypothetical protein L1887_03175 [Cichorium endivia]|nr:hypothetical protein L1887_03175 [Cichorium endivia]
MGRRKHVLDSAVAALQFLGIHVTNAETVGVVVGSVSYRWAKRIVNLEEEEEEEDLNGNLQSSSNADF